MNECIVKDVKMPLGKKFNEEMKKDDCILQIVPQSVNIKFNAFDIIPVFCDVKVYNTSVKKQRVLILPPQTKYFELEGSLSGWIFPGLPLHFRVILNATSSRFYQDWITIRCGYKDEFIQISAEPDLTNVINLPNKIDFGIVHLGKKVTSTITLYPIPDKELFFQFLFLRPNPDCQICPMKGKLKKEPLEIEITYMPTAYITLEIPVQLYLPMVSATPYYFKIYAVTKPSTIGDGIFLNSSTKKVFKNYTVLKPSIKQQKISQIKKQVKTIIKIPKLTRYDTNLMLIRKSEWDKVNDELLGPFGRNMNDELMRKQGIQQLFLEKVDKLKNENDKTFFHHRTKLMEANIPQDILQEITYDRTTAWQELKVALSQGNDHHSDPLYIRQRTIRNLNRNLDLEFSNIKSNEWFVRFQVHKKFVEVIRRVVIHNRLLKQLHILKMLTPEDISFLEVM